MFVCVVEKTVSLCLYSNMQTVCRYGRRSVLIANGIILLLLFCFFGGEIQLENRREFVRMVKTNSVFFYCVFGS